MRERDTERWRRPVHCGGARGLGSGSGGRRTAIRGAARSTSGTRGSERGLGGASLGVRSVSPALLAFGATFPLRRAERRSAMATATRTVRAPTDGGDDDAARASLGFVTAPARPLNPERTDRTDRSVYPCECGHVLRGVGGGRHRVYFEMRTTGLDEPVIPGLPRLRAWPAGKEPAGASARRGTNDHHLMREDRR